MAYSHTNSKGNTYFLHGRERKTKNGSTTLYFFSKESEGGLDAVPAGRVVAETASGMLVLKKEEK